jgi:photosystem II stability/assembly factor-like uncharacterized protein
MFFSSCISDKKFVSNPRFTRVVIDTLTHENMSCRAIVIDKNRVWYAANDGNYGYLALDTLADFKGHIAKENFKIEFRSIAQTSQHVFILSIGNPALLYRINKKTTEIKLVYQENHEKVFYDSMQFFNDLEGYAVGDPTESCPSLIKTVDGGETWQKVSCDNLPKFEEGEAFFAASNTNLVLKGNSIWMVSGGKKSKVYRSLDKGKTWASFDTPIIQGQAMTGAFTADFYDEKIGVITGGNYEKLESNVQNKAITNDGGETWQLIDDRKAFGYASCIQYLPNSDGNIMVSIGPAGLFYFRKKDRVWKQLSEEKDKISIRFGL